MAQSSETRRIDATELIAQGRAALLRGDKERARSLLGAVVVDDPENVEGWLWLSGAHTDPDEISYCLYHVLLLDPDNEQAQEGLAWVQATYGSEQQVVPPPQAAQAQTEAPPQPAITPSPRTAGSKPRLPRPLEPAPAATLAPPRPVLSPATSLVREQQPGSAFRLLEAGLQVGIVGALLGLLRLVGMLRPGTLLLVRGRAGEIDALSALLFAGATALLHGLALIVAWLILSRSLSRARNDRQGDLFDTMIQAAQPLTAGYLVGVALLIAGAGLNWSEQRWLPVVAVVWTLLVISGLWLIRRLVRLLDDMRVSRDRRALRLLRIVFPTLLVALAGLGLAGVAVQALLRAL